MEQDSFRRVHVLRKPMVNCFCFRHFALRKLSCSILFILSKKLALPPLHDFNGIEAIQTQQDRRQARRAHQKRRWEGVKQGVAPDFGQN